MRPSTSSMTASIIGCDAFSAERSLTVASQCSSQGRRLSAGAVARGRAEPSVSVVRIIAMSTARGPFLKALD